jgi:ribosomal protein S18 acetylase RimI-like enzyme
VSGISIRHLDAEGDRVQLRELFRSFDAKAYQQRVQGLDPDRLAAFLAEQALRAASSSPAWVAAEGDRLVGLAALQTEHWHSEHLGFPVGKVTQMMTAPGADESLRPLLDVLEAKAREFSLRHLAVRVDGHAFAAQGILGAGGWYPVGTSVKFAARLEEEMVREFRLPHPDPRSPTLEIRPCRSEDREAVLRIASEGHMENHLFFDPHLPDEACHAIFRRWVEKCLDGLAAQVWVAEIDGRVAGFTTILDPKSFNEALGTRIAVLDYIVLDPAVQGKGLGSQFLNAVHTELAQDFDQVELRTTGTNFAAINLYARHGYRLVGTDQVFARWLG